MESTVQTGLSGRTRLLQKCARQHGLVPSFVVAQHPSSPGRRRDTARRIFDGQLCTAARAGTSNYIIVVGAVVFDEHGKAPGMWRNVDMKIDFGGS